MHKICVQHLEQIWTTGFICDPCRKVTGQKKKENKYTARREYSAYYKYSNLLNAELLTSICDYFNYGYVLVIVYNYRLDLVITSSKFFICISDYFVFNCRLA